MGGETEMPDFALLPGRKKRLRGSGWRENLTDIFHRAYGVKLVEIHMIGVETLQGALARSLRGYERYYERWALTWEFQSLLRARPVAGDAGVADRFLRLV